VMNSSLIGPVDSGNSSGPPAVRKRGSRRLAKHRYRNKLGTDYRRPPVKWVDQHIRKSLRSKDGLVFYPAHNASIAY